MWAVFAFGSAVFAALTSVLAKIGINGVQSNLATAVRTVVVLVMAWGMVFLTDGQGGIASVSRKSWLFWFFQAWQPARRGSVITGRCSLAKRRRSFPLIN